MNELDDLIEDELDFSRGELDDLIQDELDDLMHGELDDFIQDELGTAPAESEPPRDARSPRPLDLELADLAHARPM
eukprot:7134124-Pyramimonas_sp.AAC.1